MDVTVAYYGTVLALAQRDQHHRSVGHDVNAGPPKYEAKATT